MRLPTLVDAFFEYRVCALSPLVILPTGHRQTANFRRSAAARSGQRPVGRAALDLLQFLLNLPRAFEVTLDGRHHLHCPFHEALLAARTT